VREWLESYLDHDLGPKEERAVRDHLRGCAECARELEIARAIRSELRSLPEFDTPARVLWSVRMATSDSSAGKRVRTTIQRYTARPVLAAAASVLVVVIAAVVWLQRPAPAPSLDDPEVARAIQQTRYAFALVGELGRRAALDELLGDRVVSPTIRSLSKTLGKSEKSNLVGRPEAEFDEVETEGS
jgi:anti-sigma factor RsiW